MNKIKKIFLILILTIISILDLQLNAFALNNVNEWTDDLIYRIKQTAEYGTITSEPTTLPCVDKYGQLKWIMIYKYETKAASTDWTYNTTGYVVHDKPTVSSSASVSQKMEKFGLYTADISTMDIWGGEKTRLIYTESIGTNKYVTYADVTDFVNNEVKFGENFIGSIYFSKILKVNYYGTEKGPYKRFKEFLNGGGKSPFTSGATFTDGQLVTKAEKGYYNKGMEISKKILINVTKKYVDTYGNEILPSYTYTNVSTSQDYTYENEVWDNNGRLYYFNRSYYKKEGVPGDFSISNNRTLHLPETPEEYNLTVYGEYKPVATFNVHYIKEGGNFNNTYDRVLDSISNENVFLPKELDVHVWKEINPSDNLVDARYKDIANIKLCDSNGTVGKDFKSELESEGKEVTWNNLIDRLKTYLTSDEIIQINDVWSDGEKIVFRIYDYTYINLVIEYKPSEAERIPASINIHCVASTTAHAPGSDNCIRLNSSGNPINGTKIKTIIDNNHYIGEDAGEVEIPTTINQGGKTYTLVNSYFANTVDGNEWHAYSESNPRNPSTLHGNLDIVAEYSDGTTIPDGIPVYVYYIKEGTDRRYLNSSNSVSKHLGNFYVDETIYEPLPSMYTFGGENLELKRSYIVYEDKASQNERFRSSKDGNNTDGVTTFVTARNIIVSEPGPIYIFAEYGPRPDDDDDGPNDVYTAYTMGDLDNNARGLIASEESEPGADDQYYNVYRGIPSGSNIQTQVKADNYLYTLSGYEVSGNRDYTVDVAVSFSFKWNCTGCACPGHNGSHSESCSETCTSSHRYTDNCDGICNGHTGSGSKTYTYTVNRNFKFYTISSYEVFKLKTAYVENELLTKNNPGYELWYGDDVDVTPGIDPNFKTHVNFHYGDTFKHAISVTESTTKTLSTCAKGATPPIPYENWRADYVDDAEGSIVQIEVKNDSLTVDGQNLVSGSWTNTNAPKPGSESERNSDGIVFDKDVSTEFEREVGYIQIPTTKPNGHYETYASIRYVSQETFEQEKSADRVTNIEGFKENQYLNNIPKKYFVDIDADAVNADCINDVAIHTPVFIDMTVNYDETKDYNQSLDEDAQNMSAIQLVGEENVHDEITVPLDRKFTIDFTVDGRNRNIKAYDNKDTIYTENWLAEVPQIKFPFAVYVNTTSNDTMLCEANTWYDVTNFHCGYNQIGDAGGSITVTVPVWTEEGVYAGADGIIMRVIAQNDIALLGNRKIIGNYEVGNWNKSNPDNSSVEGTVRYTDSIGDSRTNDKIKINVVGRVYDYKLTYTDDPNYKNEFLNGNFIDRGIVNLPFGQGKHILYKKDGSSWVPFAERADNITNTYSSALRLGSKIRFDLKTKGKASETIKIVPTFYWVNKNEGELQKVDAYYKDANGKRVKLTPDTGLVENITVQNATENNSNLLTTEIINTKQIDRVSGSYNYGKVTNIGKTGKVLLGTTERLAYNILTDAYAKNYGMNQTVSSVTTDAGGITGGITDGINNILASNSHWYGEFTLPENTWFVLEDGSVNNAIHYKGYVVVFFNIVTLDKNGSEYLSYQLPSNDTQWDKEGWGVTKKIKLPNGREIDDRSISTDHVGIAIYDANVNKNGSSVIITH